MSFSHYTNRKVGTVSQKLPCMKLHQAVTNEMACRLSHILKPPRV